MKTELLAHLNELLTLVNALPEDAKPPPPTPRDLVVLNTYGGTDSPLTLELGWDAAEALVQGDVEEILEVRQVEPHPGDWQPVTFSTFNPGPGSVRASYHIHDPGVTVLAFRLRLRRYTGECCEPVEMNYTVP